MIFNNEDIIINIINFLDEKKDFENIIDCDDLKKKKFLYKYYLVNKNFNNVLNFSINNCKPIINYFNNIIYCNMHTKNIKIEIINILDEEYYNELQYVEKLKTINFSNIKNGEDIMYIHFKENISNNIEFYKIILDLFKLYNFRIVNRCCNNSGFVIKYNKI
jgi:hypothetical protein